MQMVIRKMAPFVVLALTAFSAAAANSAPAPAPPPNAQTAQSIVLAGGCFWGMEAVFDHVKGVTEVTPGYAGGDADTAHYEMVSTGRTGHAESVQVTFDPSVVSLDELLKIYFVAAHDPTELNYQGPDHGTQYRSAVFYANPQQLSAAQSVMATVAQEKLYSGAIVTQFEPLKAFYPAEKHHWNYAALHPNDPYIVYNDHPRVENVKKNFPNDYTDPKS